MLPMLSRFGGCAASREPMAVEHCHDSFPGFDVSKGEIPGDVPPTA
jgi:hypothetical protein